MTARRAPQLKGEALIPNLFQEIYTPETILDIIKTTRLDVIAAEQDWLLRELDACAIYYSAQLRVDAKSGTGQKTSAGWHEYVTDLAFAFNRAFGSKATATLSGPFCRFALAAMKIIGLTEITPNMIRDTLRKKRPKGK